MSKIALTPNASGSGTFTIASPNSNTDRVLTLPDGSATLATTNGITEADEWRLTTNTSAFYDGALSANWERNDNLSFYIGTGMTQSSGLFAFPTTGIYAVDYSVFVQKNGEARGIFCLLQGTDDNGSNYTTLCEAAGFLQQTNGNQAHLTITGRSMFDVTDTSTHKVRLYVTCDDVSTVVVGGNTDRNRTIIRFIRLGDT